MLAGCVFKKLRVWPQAEYQVAACGWICQPFIILRENILNLSRTQALFSFSAHHLSLHWVAQCLFKISYETQSVLGTEPSEQKIYCTGWVPCAQVAGDSKLNGDSSELVKIKCMEIVLLFFGQFSSSFNSLIFPVFFHWCDILKFFFRTWISIYVYKADKFHL